MSASEVAACAPELAPFAYENSAQTYTQHALAGGLGFAHPIHQRTRYAGLRRHLRLAGKSLLDYGCGHGDLLADLVCAGEVPSGYHGVDLLPANLRTARARARELLGVVPEEIGVRFGGEPEGTYDVVCCLAVLSVDEGAQTEELWRATLQRLWQRTGEALVFDLLREEPGRDHPGHRRLPPARIATLAAELSPNHLIDGTLADHYSLVVVHKAPTAARRFWELRDA
jgi:SAM-dependent methyltransferase